MGLRDELLACKLARQESRLLRVEPPQVPGFLLTGQAVEVIEVPTVDSPRRRPSPEQPCRKLLFEPGAVDRKNRRRRYPSGRLPPG